MTPRETHTWRPSISSEYRGPSGGGVHRIESRTVPVGQANQQLMVDTQVVTSLNIPSGTCGLVQARVGLNNMAKRTSVPKSRTTAESRRSGRPAKRAKAAVAVEPFPTGGSHPPPHSRRTAGCGSSPSTPRSIFEAGTLPHQPIGAQGRLGGQAPARSGRRIPRGGRRRSVERMRLRPGRSHDAAICSPRTGSRRRPATRSSTSRWSTRSG